MNNATAEQFVLADLRKRAGLSQLEVARRMNVSKPRVGQIERDYPRIRFNVLESYMLALGGHIRFSVPEGTDVRSDAVAPDPRGPREHGYRKRDVPTP